MEDQIWPTKYLSLDFVVVGSKKHVLNLTMDIANFT